MRWCLSVCESDVSGLTTYDVYHIPIHTEIAIKFGGGTKCCNGSRL